MGKLPQRDDTKAWISRSIEEARKLNHNYVGTEHLLLGLVSADCAGLSVIRSLGATPERVREQAMKLLGNVVPVGKIVIQSPNEPDWKALYTLAWEECVAHRRDTGYIGAADSHDAARRTAGLDSGGSNALRNE
jgi:ATP-dependent Clp protease ATP-binding subunit ClpA